MGAVKTKDIPNFPPKSLVVPPASRVREERAWHHGPILVTWKTEELKV